MGSDRPGTHFPAGIAGSVAPHPEWQNWSFSGKMHCIKTLFGPCVGGENNSLNPLKDTLMRGVRERVRMKRESAEERLGREKVS